MTATPPAFCWDAFWSAERIRVLVVDPTPLYRILVRQVLTSTGFTTLQEAPDAARAFTEIGLWQPDLLITDLALKPYDGIALARQVRSSPDSPNPMLPIIALAGGVDVPRLRAARDAGVNEVVAKPFSAHALLRKLRNLVEVPRRFVIAPGFVGPDRRRVQEPLTQGRRNPHGHPDATVLPPAPLLQYRLRGETSVHRAEIAGAVAALRTTQQAWAREECAAFGAMLRDVRQQPPAAAYAAIEARLEAFAARLMLAGLQGPVTIARALRRLLRDHRGEATSAVIDCHLDALQLLLREAEADATPARFVPLAMELRKLVRRPPRPRRPEPVAAAAQ